jgi:hypothetical protein
MMRATEHETSMPKPHEPLAAREAVASKIDASAERSGVSGHEQEHLQCARTAAGNGGSPRQNALSLSIGSFKTYIGRRRRPAMGAGRLLQER